MRWTRARPTPGLRILRGVQAGKDAKQLPSVIHVESDAVVAHIPNVWMLIIWQPDFDKGFDSLAGEFDALSSKFRNTSRNKIGSAPRGQLAIFISTPRATMGPSKSCNTCSISARVSLVKCERFAVQNRAKVSKSLMSSPCAAQIRGCVADNRGGTAKAGIWIVDEPRA